MLSTRGEKTWTTLSRLLAENEADRVREFLATLPAPEIARALARLDEDEQGRLLVTLPPKAAADLLEELSNVQGADLLEDLPVEKAAAIVDEIDSDVRADLLGELDRGDAEAILAEMDPEEARDARKLLDYAPDTAGGLMITEFLSYRDTITVAGILDDLRVHHREYADYPVQYVYIVNARHELIGVVPLRELVLSDGETPVTQIMFRNPLSIHAESPLEELEPFFDRHPYFGAPVLDAHGRIVGVVQRSAVEAALGKRADRTFMRFSGIIGGDELRHMPLPARAGKRLAWLTLNIVLNIIAASVIIKFQNTLEAAIMLAVFLPIISDMSGCSGNQAVAVSIRELSLGIITPRDYLRVLFKELQVGFPNGLALGTLLGGLAFLYSGFNGAWNPYLALVVGGALCLNTLLSVLVGGFLPLAIKRLKLDPAIVAAPLLTTLTDMCGFFMLLGFATAVLSKLAS